MGFADDANALIQQKQFDDLESLWMGQLDSDPSDVDAFLRTAKSLRKAEQRRPLGADSVEHRSDVRDALLERRHVRNRIGKAGSGLVIQDQPSEGGEPFEKAAEAQVGPLQVEMRDETRDDDQIRPTVSDDLVRDAYLASLDIPRLRLLHE